MPQTQEEDKFEDVNIDDPKPAPPKKKGIFARMLESDDHADTNSRQASSNDKSGPWHHLTGRKRGQSGQGAELGAIPQRESTPKPEKKQEVKMENKLESKSESVSEAQSENEAEQQSSSQPQSQAESQPQTQSQAKAEPVNESTQAPKIKVDS